MQAVSNTLWGLMSHYSERSIYKWLTTRDYKSEYLPCTSQSHTHIFSHTHNTSRLEYVICRSRYLPFQGIYMCVCVPRGLWCVPQFEAVSKFPTYLPQIRSFTFPQFKFFPLTQWKSMAKIDLTIDQVLCPFFVVHYAFNSF